MEYSAGLTSERWYHQDIEYVLALLEQGLVKCLRCCNPKYKSLQWI